jgi:DNA-binding MarR family transcriptional regulator
VLDSLRRLVRSFRVGAHDGGPSPAQRFVLERLGEHPGASIGELARMTHTDQSSVSVVVSRLVEAGFVERRRSEDDARRAELSLTPRGRAVAKKSVPSGQAQLLAGVTSLPVARRAALARELEALCDAMGIRDEPAGMFFEHPKAGRAAPATSAPKTARRRR